MKKLFTISDVRSVFVIEEGNVYELVDWKKEERTYCDATGHLLPDYLPQDPGETEEEATYIGDPSKITDLVNGFYGYTTHEIEYFPGGRDGWFGVKRKDGTKVTEEIFAEVDWEYRYGLLSVRNKEKRWGCIDESGNLVIPYQFSDYLRFNQYGVAVGNNTFVDRQGNEIPGTDFNLSDWPGSAYRYYTTALLSEEQLNSIDASGRAAGILLDIYDTKLRKYIARGVPDGKLEVMFFEGEAEVILAAIELLLDYDKIELEGQGLIKAKKNGSVDVYDYYQA